MKIRTAWGLCHLAVAEIGHDLVHVPLGALGVDDPNPVRCPDPDYAELTVRAGPDDIQRTIAEGAKRRAGMPAFYLEFSGTSYDDNRAERDPK